MSLNTSLYRQARFAEADAVSSVSSGGSGDALFSGAGCACISLLSMFLSRQNEGVSHFTSGVMVFGLTNATKSRSSLQEEWAE